MQIVIKELKEVVMVYSFSTILLGLLLISTNWLGSLVGKLVKRGQLTNNKLDRHYDRES